MWPFDRTQTERGPDPVGVHPEGELDALRLAALSDRLDKLSKRIDGIEMEWNEWFDKFRRLYARLAKRQERDEVAEAAQTDTKSHQDAVGRTNGIQPVSGGPFPRRNY